LHLRHFGIVLKINFISFLLHRVNPEEVNSMALRVRVYGCERMRRERLIGETIISFASIDLELESNLWLLLESRNNSIVRKLYTILHSICIFIYFFYFSFIKKVE